MHFYELTYLMRPDLTEKELREERESIANLITKNGGILNEVNLPKKIRLAFPIQKMKEGFLADLNFFLERGKLKEIEKGLKSNGKIVRFLILRKKGERPMVEIQRLKPKKEKVSLEEIDKKLKEILKENV